MARQTIQLPAATWNQSSAAGGWSLTGVTRVELIPAFSPDGGRRYLSGFHVARDGRISLSTISIESGRFPPLQFASLTDKFEASGGLDVTVGGTAYSFEVGGLWTQAPYSYTTPSNGADATAIYAYNRYRAEGATLVIRDGPLFAIKYGTRDVAGFRYGSSTPAALYRGSTRVF